MAAHERDRTLARAVVDGRRGAAEALFDQVFDRLYRLVCARLGGDHDAAQDIVSESLHNGLRGLRGYRGEASLIGWFAAIAVRRIADAKRRRAARLIREGAGELDALMGVAVAKGVPPLEGLVDDETRALVREAVASLPLRHQTVLQWKYFDESSLDEVAVRLRVTPKAAERRLERARAALAAALRRRRIDF
jgi:RNA polymerase sigma-70 factor (ECF subfamily)